TAGGESGPLRGAAAAGPGLTALLGAVLGAAAAAVGAAAGAAAFGAGVAVPAQPTAFNSRTRTTTRNLGLILLLPGVRPKLWLFAPWARAGLARGLARILPARRASAPAVPAVRAL